MATPTAFLRALQGIGPSSSAAVAAGSSTTPLFSKEQFPPLEEVAERDPVLRQLMDLGALHPATRKILVERDNDRIRRERTREQIRRLETRADEEEKTSIFDSERGLFAHFFGIPTPFLQVGTFLGIENPVLRFAADLLLDPISFITGIGVWNKIGLAGQKLAKAARGGSKALTPRALTQQVVNGARTIARRAANPEFSKLEESFRKSAETYLRSGDKDAAVDVFRSFKELSKPLKKGELDTIEKSLRSQGLDDLADDLLPLLRGDKRELKAIEGVWTKIGIDESPTVAANFIDALVSGERSLIRFGVPFVRDDVLNVGKGAGQLLRAMMQTQKTEGLLKAGTKGLKELGGGLGAGAKGSRELTRSLKIEGKVHLLDATDPAQSLQVAQNFDRDAEVLLGVVRTDKESGLGVTTAAQVDGTNYAASPHGLHDLFMQETSSIAMSTNAMEDALRNVAGTPEMDSRFNRILGLFDEPQELDALAEARDLPGATTQILKTAKRSMRVVGEELLKRGKIKELFKNYFSIRLKSKTGPVGDQLRRMAKKMHRETSLPKAQKGLIEEALENIQKGDPTSLDLAQQQLLDIVPTFFAARGAHKLEKSGTGSRHLMLRVHEMFDDAEKLVAEFPDIFEFETVLASKIFGDYMRSAVGVIARDRLFTAMRKMPVEGAVGTALGLNKAALHLDEDLAKVLSSKRAEAFSQAKAAGITDPDEIRKFVSDAVKPEVLEASLDLKALGYEQLADEAFSKLAFHKSVFPQIRSTFERDWFKDMGRKLSPGIGQVLKGLSWVNDVGKASLFNLNPFFHATALTFSNFALLPPKVAVANARDVWNLWKSTARKTDPDAIWRAMERVMRRTHDVAGDDLWEQLSRSPLKLGRQAHLGVDEGFGALDKALLGVRNTLPENELVRSPIDGIRKWNMLSDFSLWTVMQNVFKTNATIHMRHAWVERMVKKGHALSKNDLQNFTNEAAQIANQAFGGLAWERLLVQKTTQRFLRFAMLAPDWCCSADTRAMTKRGWKYHHELSPGDEIMVFDPELGRLKWSPLKGKYERDDYSGPMVEVKNYTRSILMTPDHTCYVWNFSRGTHEVVKAEELKSSHQIPRVAPYDLPEEDGPFTDDFLKIVGWYVTDGYMKKSRQERADGKVKEYRYGRITQAKPPMVAMIKELGLSFTVEKKHYDHGAFKANYPKYVFNIPVETFRKMEDLGIDSELNWEFLSTLSRRQLELLYETMMYGNGTGQNRFADEEEPVFFMTLIQTLLGHATTFYQQEAKCWRTRTIDSSTISVYGRADVVDYDGTIWCPETETGFWLAERNGLVFITGNTMANLLMARDLFVNIPGIRNGVIGKTVARDTMMKDMRFHWAAQYNIRAAAYGYLFSNLLNFGMTKFRTGDGRWLWENDEESKDPKTGWPRVEMAWLREDGRRQFMDMFRQFTEPIGLVRELPLKFLQRKQGVLPRTFTALINGEDSFGNPVAGARDGPMAEMMKRMGEAGWQFAPIAVQAGFERLAQGGITPQAFPFSVLGFPVSTESKRGFERRGRIAELEDTLR